MKLSRIQKETIARMQVAGDWKSAYGLRASLATLDSLRKKGIVKAKGEGEPGAWCFRRTHVLWKLADSFISNPTMPCKDCSGKDCRACGGWGVIWLYNKARQEKRNAEK